MAAAGIWSASYPELRQFWDEYPAIAEARRSVQRFSALVATSSPLTEDQSKALTATLAAENKRRRVEDDRFLIYPYDDRLAYLELEEQRLKAREESNRRIVETAKSYLDAGQLAVIQESMSQYSARTQAALRASRQRLERQLDRVRQ